MTPNTAQPLASVPRPIRVISLIARLNLGGPAKLLNWTAAGLDPERFEHILAAGRVPPGEEELGPWGQKHGGAYIRVPLLGRAINPLRDIFCLARILGLLIRIKPHVLSTHTAKAGFIGRSALLVYRPLAALMGWPRTKALHTFHGHIFHSYFGKSATALFLFMERFLARWASWKILVISPQQYQEIHMDKKVGRKEQIEIVPIGVDLNQFRHPEKGKKEFRRELGLGDDELLFGAVGRMAAVKNYPMVVHTAAKLKELAPELYRRSRFVLIGGGKPEALRQIKELAAGLRVQERFQVMGYRHDPERFFPALDVLLLTSLNEGVPVSILEAGACARPVLATGVGGVGDLLGPQALEHSHGFVVRQRGVSVPGRDASAMARGLAHLMDHPDLAAGLGEALREYVRRAHSKDAYVSHMADLFTQAAENT